MKQLLIATANPAKKDDYLKHFKNSGIEILTLDNIDIKEKPVEDGKTFEENAIKKAKFYVERTGYITLGDDGGLTIDALDGEPGPLSRRWPGYEATDEELIQYALEKLKGVTREKRTAWLGGVLALAFPTGEVKIFKVGRTGVITEQPAPKRVPGYPFRSIFYLSKIKKLYCDLTPEELMGELNHRTEAINEIIKILNT